MSRVRILIADDHEVVRRGLRALLEAERGWEVVGEAADGREAVEAAKRLRPDVAILDLTMPELNGLDATRKIRRAVPSTEVLILTMHESEQAVREVLAAGARGYVLKTDAGRDLVRAVAALRERKPFLTPGVSDAVLEGYLKGGGGAAGAAGERVTPRERETLQLLAEGRTNKEVAARLGIAPKTAETHRANLMRKLRLHSIGELVRYAIRNRIVEP